ncbi:MAG: polyamine aminopropyltransferase, partial [Saprospiraceae bacterium]
MRSNILKLALFATGLSGIVAEYVLATLASYFMGDSIRQWALVISLMLFCMGIGSRVTQRISKNLFAWFVSIEFTLSAIVSFSALITYSFAAYAEYTGVLIYGLCMLTGLLIGMELPLAIRLNETFEELKVNVSSILEQDYYGSLLGGLFFAFIGLPYLGLTYTPFILGAINLSVAIVLLYFFPIETEFKYKKWFGIIAIALASSIGISAYHAEEIILHGEQSKYLDKVVLSEQSRYQKIVLTEWKDDYWLYLNGNLQFSSYDEPLYHEVLVHPAMHFTPNPQHVLILGGGDGCAARELLKYPNVDKITLVDLDPAITNLAQQNDIFLNINQRSLLDSKVNIVNQDAFVYLDQQADFYDLIIIDLPDPRSVEMARLYSLEFYQMCRLRLRPNGVLITQAGSPYFAASSFQCIEKTMQAADFSTLPLHNQIITMGEWGWVLALKNEIPSEQIKSHLQQINLENIPTQWLNQAA